MSEQGSGALAPEGYDIHAGEQGDSLSGGQRIAIARALMGNPHHGTRQQVVIHTAGDIVTPAQPLMVIVPQDQPVEAMLENKDIGFVHPGQPVTVKAETFTYTYTKYGTLDGTVASVSRDAIEDEKRGLIYRSKIRLYRDHLNINSQDIKLSPDMAVTVEVKTDQRRVIEYFISPLQQYASESARER